MPARVVDGAGLWRSKKLKNVSQEYRAEYANLLPLAEANGVFDCDPERVWSDVYAFNRPEITVEMVDEILDEFEAVDLLRRWSEKGKQWGYWMGINKSGRLPTEAHIKRYKNLPPNPPPDLFGPFIPSGTDPELSGIIRDNPGEVRTTPVGFGIGLDRNGIGMDREEPKLDNDEFPENGQGEEMKAKKQIPILCYQLLGVRAETYPDVLNQIEARAIVTSNGQVVREFEDWAAENQHEEFRGKPLTAFLKSLEGVGVVQRSENPVVKAAGREIAYRTDNQVALNPKAKSLLTPVVEEENYTVQEVVDSFMEFFNTIDPAKIPYAGINFAGEAYDRLYATRRKHAEKKQESGAVEAAKLKMQREAEEDRVRRAQEAEREAELVEEGLPD